MHFYILTAFAIYFSLLLLIGFICHRKLTSSSDFIMGNRSLNFWLVALSAHASDMSAWLFTAFPTAIFTLGLSQAWIAIGLIGGMFLNWQLVAPRLRSMTEQYGCYTLSSFFDKRFNDHSGNLRLMSALIMVVFLTLYLSAGLIVMGNFLESLFGLPYLFGLSLAVVVVVIYTFIGGFNTVAWIDLFQGIFLLLMILFVPYVAFTKIGGWGEIGSLAQKKSISLSLVPDGNFSSFLASLVLALNWGLGYFGMPHIITKFMGIKHASELKKSKWIGMSWQMIALGAAAMIGLVGIAYFPEGLAKPEMVFIEMVKDLFHPFMIGFILCAVIAANLSTMDSQILVCASILSEDLYKHFKKTPPTEQKMLWVSKLSVVLLSLVALLLASNKSATISSTVLYAWSGLGSAFGPLVLISLYSKITNRHGALAGMITGAVVVLIWPTLNHMMMTYQIPPMIPGFFSNLLVFYSISFLMKKSELNVEAVQVIE